MPRPTPVDRDRRILVFIGERIAELGYAPTYREIADQFGIAIKTVVDALNRLQTSGAVTWQVGRTRTLRLTEEGR